MTAEIHPYYSLSLPECIALLFAKDELLAQFGAWASLGYLPAGFKSDVSRQRSNEYAWHFDKLESKIMTPSLAYVQAAMRHGDVPTSLKNWSFKSIVATA